MNMPYLRLALCLLCLSIAPAFAGTEPATPATGPQSDAPESADGPATSRTLKPREPSPLNGLVVDRTITMIGKTFYQQFSQRRLDSIVLNNTNLVIHERPSARWGSIVWVAEGNRILYQATLPPRLSDVDQYARAAVEQVEQLVLRRKVMQALDRNGDLAGDEW